MVDITHKHNTLRIATAEATVSVSKQSTIDAIHTHKVPKGNVLEAARTAGLFGVKRTSDLIPDCHPLPIEYAAIEYSFDGLEIKITMTVKTIYKTGVEVEAMHGASVVALTMYDMLKPIDKGVEVNNIRLVSKKGGKSDYKDRFLKNLTAGVVVCSDTISAGQKEDKAGKAIIEKLETAGVAIAAYEIIPDEKEVIQRQVKTLNTNNCDLIIFTGGTGLSVRDVTPEAIEPLLDRQIPGIAEAIRSYGQDRMPYAMLSRSIVGTMGRSLIMALPGSTKGAAESMDAVFPFVLHAFNVLRGARHD